MSLESITSYVGTAGSFLDTTILVALAGVVWTFSRRIAQELYFLMSLRTREIELPLNPKGAPPDSIESLNVLFIRYGNDTYLSTIASDQERYHGRLRNKIICVANKPNLSGDPLRVRLKVHKRLGTQFKFFVDVAGPLEPVWEYLKSHAKISVDPPNEILLPGPAEIKKYRIYFLIDWVDTAKTVENFTNNIVYPV